MENRRMVAIGDQWSKVSQDLATESLKLAAYDEVVYRLLGEVEGQRILDYGAGPALMASALTKLGAQVHTWDIDEKMRRIEAERLGSDRVFDSVESIPDASFAVILCNLVVCIITAQILEGILDQIHRILAPDGRVFIGFCNPRIFQVRESRLDFRFPTGADYCACHTFKKRKKEGNYEIEEIHRPVEWYHQTFETAGLSVSAIHYTPPYDLGETRSIRDFVVFELTKA